MDKDKYLMMALLGKLPYAVEFIEARYNGPFKENDLRRVVTEAGKRCQLSVSDICEEGHTSDVHEGSVAMLDEKPFEIFAELQEKGYIQAKLLGHSDLGHRIFELAVYSSVKFNYSNLIAYIDGITATRNKRHLVGFE